MKLAYQAVDRAGSVVSDVIDATGLDEATENLRRQGLFVTRIDSAQSADLAPKTKAGRLAMVLGRGRRLKQLAMFTRQFHVLVATGTPVAQTLAALKRQQRDPYWKSLIASLEQRVEEGGSLSDALSEYPEHFDGVYLSLITAGEAGGNFGDMLQRLSELVRKQLSVRQSVVGALIYPCLLVFVAVAVLCLMLLFVLPRFGGLFATLDMPLPPTTAALMVLSGLLQSYGWVLLALIPAAVLGARAYIRSAQGRRKWDHAVLHLPLFGRITRNFATARVVRLLGVLIDCHVPLLEALHLTRQATNNIYYGELLDQAELDVSRGQSISSSFENSDLINPTVYEAIHNGEQTGQVAPLLLGIANFMDEENDTLVRSLTSILEPMILIALGAVVAFVAISMFMPLFDLTAMTGAGGPGGGP